jgi:putative MFS transporter
MLIFSAFSLCSAYTPTGQVTLLAIFRFLTGVGLGGETPVVTSLMGEFMPSKHRGKLQGLLNSFWAIGWLAAAATALFFIPNLGPESFATSIVPDGEGWRVAFIIGALPALYIFYVRRSLPESPRWLASKGKETEAVQIVENIEKEVAQTREIPPVSEADIIKHSQQSAKFPASILFQDKYLKRTLVLWTLWFFGMAGYYGLFSWLPSLLNKMGHSLDNAFLQIMLMQLFYVPNQILAAYMMDMFGRKRLLTINLLLAAVFAMGYGWTILHNMNTGIVLSMGCLTAFFVSAIFAIAYTYTPELYPTSVRVTGTAWAAASSRVGSMLMPTGIGLIITGASGSYFPVFIVISCLFLIPAITVGIWGIETKGLSLDEI